MTIAAPSRPAGRGLLSPGQHAIADYATAAAFACAGVALRARHPRASGLAFFHAASVLAASLLTRYPGGLAPAFGFRTHGRLDLLMAGTNAVGPAVLGFADDAEASWFHATSLMELGVVTATDFGAGT